MLAHLRRGSTRTTEKDIRRMVKRLKGASSTRKEEIKIGSLRRALRLAINKENMNRFSSSVTQNQEPCLIVSRETWEE
jgi:hypothetical protein